MELRFERDKLVWLNEPRKYEIGAQKVVIGTQAHTDFWQRTYYGFQNDNAHSLLTEVEERYFSFVVRSEFASKRRFDQCGVLVYLNSDNWIKVSVEYENEAIQRLGSVVTNHGYSDWASVDIPAAQKYMYYRLSRRGSDFCVENSYDGISFHQMRIAHLFEGADKIRVGIYACSPEASSFEAVFTEMRFEECRWSAHAPASIAEQQQ